MPPDHLPESVSWVLALGDSLRAAVSERELVHLIEAPVLLEVPLSPPYCRHVVAWNQMLLPAMDLSAWLLGSSPHNSRSLAGVFAYQARRGANPDYGALLLADIPTRIRVTDNLACGLPKNPPTWRSVAISCFKQDKKAIPILDLRHIFSGGLL